MLNLVIASAAWAAKPKKKPIDVSAHIDEVTLVIWVGLALIALFFLLRPELWRRLWFKRVDPRPAALVRLLFGATVLWTFVDLLVMQGETLFTEEGIWLTDSARKSYGGDLGRLWDPEQGFESWRGFLDAIWGKFTILHMRSDKPFVYGLFGLLFVSASAMTLGWYTRIATIVSWFLVNQLYNYNPVYYTGGDTVLRCFLFLGMFLRWGEAYSIDSWRRRRRAILGGAEHFPALRRIPMWPMGFMMLQLTIIYCATGVLKSGGTWVDGTALYYALNLDHFYRWPNMRLASILDYLYISRALTVVVHWWEILFPLAVVGMALRAFESDKAKGEWIEAGRLRRWASYLVSAGFVGLCAYLAGMSAYYYGKAPRGADPKIYRDEVRLIATIGVVVGSILAVLLYRLIRTRFPKVLTFTLDWLLGKRLWLGLGFGMHVGIDLNLNVGTFVQVMIAVYPAWMNGDEVEGFWRTLFWRPAAPGQAGRPEWPKARWRRFLSFFAIPMEHLRYRIRPEAVTVVYGEDEMALRRVTLLRCWDLGSRLDYVVRADAPQSLVLKDGDRRLEGEAAGRRLIALFPGLWWLWPLSRLPGAGRLVLRILHQRS